MSLNWIVRQYPNLFYPQTWYVSEPFAQQFMVGVYNEKNEPWPTVAYAAVFVQEFITRGTILWPTDYVRTSDTDHEGNAVYIGRSAQYGGLQIHREVKGPE